MTIYSIYSGVDQLGIVGTVAPGIFAQEGRCWRMVYLNPAGQAGHCMEPVAWSGRWSFTAGWARVWSCDGHAGGLAGARRINPPPVMDLPSEAVTVPDAPAYLTVYSGAMVSDVSDLNPPVRGMAAKLVVATLNVTPSGSTSR